MEPLARAIYTDEEIDTPRDSGAMTEAEKVKVAVNIIKGKDDPKPAAAIEALGYLIAQARIHLRRYEELYEAQRQRRKPSIPDVVVNETQARRDRRNKAAKAAAEIARSAFDEFLINGRQVGEIYYHELEELRSENLLAAYVADGLMKYVAPPTAPTRVRDMIAEKDFKSLLRDAKATVLEELQNWDNSAE